MRAITQCGLVIAAVLCTACAGQYRLVATEDVAAIEQCAVVSSDSYRALMDQQRQLSQGLAHLQSEIDASRARVKERLPEPVQCPDTAVVPPPEAQQTARDQVAKQRVGAVETLRFDDLSLSLPAEIDTGALHSLLVVASLQPFERNGEDWVRFTLANDREKTYERRQVRMSSAQRPVVQLRYTLGEITQRSDFALVSKHSGPQPVALGRLALRDVMVVDVSANHIATSPVESE